MKKLKYIRIGVFRNEKIVIFSPEIRHSEFKHLAPVTAGFCEIDTVNKQVRCFGDSASLGLRASVMDSDIATKQIFG